MYHEIKQTDHTVNQWISLCSLHALEYATESIQDDKTLPSATRYRYGQIKQFARNSINVSFKILEKDSQFMINDNIAAMQKLFLVACSIPNSNIEYFLKKVDEIAEEIK